jgi:hypothetical protein
MELRHKQRLSEQIRALAVHCRQRDTSTNELLRTIGDSGHELLILVLCLPFFQPIPLPGLSTALGLVIAASGLGIAFGWAVTIPFGLGNRPIPGEVLAKILDAGAWGLERLEVLLRPRWRAIFWGPASTTAVGLLIAFSGFVLALPLPPGFNTPPALVCALLCLGLLERDGVFVVAGMVLFVTFTLTGYVAIDYVVAVLRSFLVTGPTDL